MIFIKIFVYNFAVLNFKIKEYGKNYSKRH